jgi:hypothetical protein
MNLIEMGKRLDRIEELLTRLVQPVAAEEARQSILASPEQRKAHNKAALQRTKERHLRRTA